MKKLLLAAALVALPLALSAAASAKEIREIKVCGPAACRALTDQPTMSLVASGGYQTLVPAAASEYYIVTYTVDEGDSSFSWQNYYIPRSRELRGEGESHRAIWTKLTDDAATALRGLTVDLVAFPKPSITRATVGGKPVAGDPASYLELYRVGNPFFGLPTGTGFMRISLQSTTPSPWTDAAARLLYLPSRRLLWRDSQIVRLPKAIASRVVRRVALG
jgi:hypothetical protein